MADPQDRAEALDDDAEPMVAPDRPPGVQAYGAAGTDPPTSEPVARRAAREEPEPVPGQEPPPPPVRVGPRDETLDDVATERAAPVPAEVDAMHVVAEEPFGDERGLESLDPAELIPDETDEAARP